MSIVNDDHFTRELDGHTPTGNNRISAGSAVGLGCTHATDGGGYIQHGPGGDPPESMEKHVYIGTRMQIQSHTHT